MFTTMRVSEPLREKHQRFPESRRKAHYLMAIHEKLIRIPKQQFREVGWSKAVELVKVAGREGKGFDSATTDGGMGSTAEFSLSPKLS